MRKSIFFDYVLDGNHAFLACDDSELLTRIAEKLKAALIQQPTEFVDCFGIESTSEFSSVFSKRCGCLAKTLGITSFLRYRRRNRRLGIANDLRDAMDMFGSKGQQGYMVLNQFDGVVEMQKTMEIEGALRSVMQLRSDVAVVICASHSTINKLVGDSHRPFYLSFRVFRF